MCGKCYWDLQGKWELFLTFWIFDRFLRVLVFLFVRRVYTGERTYLGVLYVDDGDYFIYNLVVVITTPTKEVEWGELNSTLNWTFSNFPKNTFPVSHQIYFNTIFQSLTPHFTLILGLHIYFHFYSHQSTTLYFYLILFIFMSFLSTQ